MRFTRKSELEAEARDLYRRTAASLERMASMDEVTDSWYDEANEARKALKDAWCACREDWTDRRNKDQMSDCIDSLKRSLACIETCFGDLGLPRNYHPMPVRHGARN